MIRSIETKDKHDYYAMSKLFYQSSALIKPSKPRYLSKTIDDMVSDNPYIEGYVIEFDNDVAGYMLLTFSYSSEWGGEFVNIDELYVKDDYQGMGLGSKLLSFVEAKYKDQKAITLLVNDENKNAKKLYNKI
ncbi:MAG TPA: GNAT family N-acetyltransferase, partial [Acholeplasma sp.]|nr:GNAT family N-acetyltransferase [Acholeplasma sp.]